MGIVTVNVVRAFVDDPAGGNLAGVVLNAEPLTSEVRQYVATKVGFSETAFVSRSNKADFKVDFFTPKRQIADCGHATVGTFSQLAELGMITGQNTSKEIVDGVRNITLSDGMVYMEQTVPVFSVLGEHGDGVDAAAILAALQLPRETLHPEYPLVIADNGAAVLIVPLRGEAALRGIKPDFEAIEKTGEALKVDEFYVFSRETQVLGRDAGVRMFAPQIGIPEESATGMAAGALACYLHDFLDVGKPVLHIEQGYLMTPPSPSLLEARLSVEEGNIRCVMVGGRAVAAGSIDVEVPSQHEN